MPQVASATTRNILIHSWLRLQPKRRGYPCKVANSLRWPQDRASHSVRLLFRCVLDFHGPVLAGRGQVFAVQAESDRVDHIRMALQQREGFSRSQVPDAHGLIGAGRSQLLAVRAEGHRVELRCVSAQSLEKLTRTAVPNLGGAVLVGRRQRSSVSTEGDGVDFMRIRAPGGGGLAGSGVP